MKIFHSFFNYTCLLHITDSFLCFFYVLKKSVESVFKTCKPTGVYICGKHIAGCYFFSFLILVFSFLGLFGYGFFEMNERAKQANVKLQVIRDEITVKIQFFAAFSHSFFHYRND